MSGINSSVPAEPLAPPRPVDASLVSFSVHSMPEADRNAVAKRTARGRLVMTLVLAVCAAPVVAAYLAYFVVRPGTRTNYSELILPAVALPSHLSFTDLAGHSVKGESLKGQWLIVVVAGASCQARCEHYLWLQRQLRETLGAERGRVDKVWIVDDEAAPRAETLAAIGTVAPATVLRAPKSALGAWLRPAAGHAVEDHLYIVDPQGDWMMRTPVDPEPPRLKRDVEKLLRASAGWDQPGR